MAAEQRWTATFFHQPYATTTPMPARPDGWLLEWAGYQNGTFTVSLRNEALNASVRFWEVDDDAHDTLEDLYYDERVGEVLSDDTANQLADYGRELQIRLATEAHAAAAAAWAAIEVRAEARHRGY